MIYLDYAAQTPVNDEVLETFNQVVKEYRGNPNSTHELGKRGKIRLQEATNQIARLLDIKEREIIYTSSASESNNLAIKGIAEKYKTKGKHMITTYLEHSSVSGAMNYLQNIGYEVDFVDITKSGLVDMDHLKDLLREDTILLSVCYVDSEIGLVQDIDKIGKLLTNYPKCSFHVDATQAVGKIPVTIQHIDLLTFAAHKFYGLDGCGVLIKKENIDLEPMIHGGISTTPFRSGTPALPLIASTAKALALAYAHMDKTVEYVSGLNKKLREAFEKYPNIICNSTQNSSPYIVNISISGIKASKFIQYLDKQKIYLSSKSACCVENTPSRPVYAMKKNKKAALSTLRISLSHLTTMDEIDVFLKQFEECYLLEKDKV